MKKKVVSILAAATVAASLLGGAAPLTVLADGTMVVSIGIWHPIFRLNRSVPGPSAVRW